MIVLHSKMISNHLLSPLNMTSTFLVFRRQGPPVMRWVWRWVWYKIRIKAWYLYSQSLQHPYSIIPTIYCGHTA